MVDAWDLKSLAHSGRVGSIPTGPTKQKERQMRDEFATERKQDWLHEVGEQVDLGEELSHEDSPTDYLLRDLVGVALVTDRYVEGYYGERRPIRYYEDDIYVMLIDGKIHHVTGDTLRWIRRNSTK